MFRKPLTIVALLVVSVAMFPRYPSIEIKKDKIIYHQDSLGNRVLDFSYCGYKNSTEDIPFISNVVFVPHQVDDASRVIQQAIYHVEQLPLNKAGFRGAVLLDEGVFTIGESLFISKSGVVLRGSGKTKTVLKKTGIERSALIHVEGINDFNVTDTIDIVSDYVPLNSRVLHVNNISKLKANDQIMVFRPSEEEWIKSLGCDHFGGGITYLGWKPGEIDIHWDRTVLDINAKTVEIDAPLTMALNAKEAQSKILIYDWPGRIEHVGIEELSIESAYNKDNLKDEDHGWTGISIANAKECWVRQVNFKHLAGSAVIIQPTGSRITVEDCISIAPVSEIGGMRRSTFLTMGQLTLFQRCYSEEGIHDFGAGYLAAGPNAFVQCESKNSHSYSGAIDSWASGLLFDIVNIDGNDLVFKNFGQDNNGAGWSTANSLFWQCTASVIECYSPNEENRNRAHGCWAQFSGDGEWNASNSHVQPRSFFYAQLSDRLGEDFSRRARLLPVSTSASTSPTLEQAREFTIEAREPKVTLKKWIEEKPSPVVARDESMVTIHQLPARKHVDSHERTGKTGITNGKISFNEQLLTGRTTGVSWWSGKLRTTQVSKATPHITRFVPGREGTGLTDRIDSVVNHMKMNDISVLDHNYGLWYDRRRDDHQRVKRKDGEVWGPFYEQPFARSGEGIAWDGLSKYDLTKPNAWYWSRLKEFAREGANKGILLFHQHYFQHNILEAGAHWVDSPWRTANNVNNTGLPEPVPFAGDKRVFMAEMFYDTENEHRRALHENYIKQGLNALAEEDNVVHLTSAEFTGPLHFVEFWLDVIDDWKKETGKDVLTALSATKDVQDAILNDPSRAGIVDIIDIRFWHYKEGGELYAPEGGKSLAPRQFARIMKTGKVSFEDVYKSVSEYRVKYPEKAVTYYAPRYPEMAWAIFMGGGSLPAIPRISNPVFLEDALKMEMVDLDKSRTRNYLALENRAVGKIIYFVKSGESTSIPISPGTYQISKVDTSTGNIDVIIPRQGIKNEFTIRQPKSNEVYWFKKIADK